MDWTPGGLSDDIEDRRGDSPGGGGFNLGGGGLGIIGIVLLAIISLVTGRNYIGAYLTGGSARTTQTDAGPRHPVQESAAEDRSAQLVSFTLTNAQQAWTRILSQKGIQYRHAKLVLYRDLTQSGCGGTADARTGPFYCPEDEKIYMDLGFWDELARLGASGEFAQAYVVAHELGHHIQNILGTEAQVRRLQSQDRSERNRLSVDLELQADCFAGIWAKSAAEQNIVHPDDVDNGLRAAASVGDDHIQRMTRGTISPESFTHGTSAQRVGWFKRGMQQGTIDACNTFKTGGELPQ